METTNELIIVSISDFKVAENPAILQTVLGSCIAICLYEPEKKIGSLAHALLPTIEYSSTKNNKNPKKYVDSLIEMQLAELLTRGVSKKKLVAKITGGANMFSEVIPESENHVGKKNAKKAKEVLTQYEIPIVATDLGNYIGRRVHFNLENGVVTIMKPTGELWKVI